MNLEELDALFDDPANRPWGIFYHCASDPRVIAPHRPNWRGYQINFAHSRAVPVLVFYVAVVICPPWLVFAYGPRDPAVLAVAISSAFVASVALLISLSAHLSKQHADPPDPPG